MSENTQNTNYGKVNVKGETKEKFDSRLKFANEKDSKKKISSDDFLNFLLTLATDEQIQKYQISTLTWEEEEPKLMELWEKKKRKKISGIEWALMFRKGELDDFIKENSRVQLF